jgi:hypothetical protein
VTSVDPFGVDGYARVRPSGSLRPLTPEELADANATAPYWPARDHALDHDHCFLWGTALTDDTRSAEHAFPQWLLRDLDLWHQTITLLNSTTIPYASLTIPACKDCNNFWLSQIESEVAAAFRAGADEGARLDQTLLALWVAKIYYGIHFKAGFPDDRRRPDRPTILSEENLRVYATFIT